MKIVIQKFGGTSVATQKSRQAVSKKVLKKINEGYSPIVVVSAMGRKGEPYATDTLINLIREENPSVNEHEMDFLMSCGENISAAVVAAHLQQAGIKARAVTGGQAGLITDDSFGEAQILKIKKENIKNLLNAGYVPVICGFQGVTEDGLNITTIGRGGSDTTATAFGTALEAEMVEIYTDVDGIMTADPRFVDNATVINCITYGEICQLAYQGAKVIHPRAVEIAMQKNIPIVIKSILNDTPGTLITNDLGEDTQDSFATHNIATGVTYFHDISQIRVETTKNSLNESTEIFDALAKNQINVDCLNIHPNEVILTVEEKNLEKACDILSDLGFKKIFTKKECAKVSVVGTGMKGIPGVMATFVRAFSEYEIPILQTVDSNITVSAVIDREFLPLALKSLHESFKLTK